MAEARPGEIIYFRMDEENPVILEHGASEDGRVVLRQTTDGEMLTLIDHNQEPTCSWRPIFRQRRRVGFGSTSPTRSPRRRPLAAIAARSASADASRSFTIEYAAHAGPLQSDHIEGRQVLMDYGQNVGALEAVGDFVRRTAAPERRGDHCAR